MNNLANIIISLVFVICLFLSVQAFLFLEIWSNDNSQVVNQETIQKTHLTVNTRECIYQLNFLGNKEIFSVKDTDLSTSDRVIERVSPDGLIRFWMFARTGWNYPESCKIVYLQLKHYDNSGVLLDSDVFSGNMTQGNPVMLNLNVTFVELNLLDIRNVTVEIAL